MRMLVATHRQRMVVFQEEQRAERGAFVEAHTAKVAEIARRQKVERDEFVERALRTATLHDLTATACSCANRYVCRHNRTASYKLRKLYPLVIRYRNAARKLLKS